MKHDNPQMIDALAAEYVLGTLRGRARRRFERWRSQEWHVERRVQAWEERLSGLALRLTPMRPSPHVWSQIERRIGTSETSGSRNQVPSENPRGRSYAPWHMFAAAAVLFAIAVAGFITWQAKRTDLHDLATLTAQNATQPAWHISADDDLKRIRAIAGPGAVAQAGKSYELWALPDNGSAPVSLGLMPVSGQIDRELSEAQRAALRGASKVAVSLEPEGGSTTSLPTGPVLFVAERVKRA
jgi:anti-sigma-K factor RskA